jgi:hypothetical protein
MRYLADYGTASGLTFHAMVGVEFYPIGLLLRLHRCSTTSTHFQAIFLLLEANCEAKSEGP